MTHGIVAILMLTLHYFVYTRALGNANKSKKIYVPPKPKPQLPFGLGGAEEPTLATDYKDTTLGEHEVALIKESAQSIILSVAMSMFFSLKFDVHVSLVMQAVMLPLNALDSIVLKKYLLGTDKNVDGGNNLYNEEDVMPTKEILDARHAAKTAAAAAAAAPIENTPPSDADAKKNE